MPAPQRSAVAALLAVFLCSTTAGSAHAAWPSDPSVNVPLCTAPGIQQFPESCSDGQGGAIVVWEDFRAGGLDLYAQRISRDGAPQWTPNGVAVCLASGTQENPAICPDGAGGVIVVWTDSRNGFGDIYVQRITSLGSRAWTTDGVAVCTAANDQGDPAICPAAGGGAIVAWRDSRSIGHIYARRIGSDGTPQWTADGVTVCTNVAEEVNPCIVADGAGGAIIAWEDYRNEVTGDLYAQRLNSSGARQWGTEGVAVCTAANSQWGAEIVPDGVGGAILTWMDKRSDVGDLYARRVSASGARLWDADGLPVCVYPGEQDGVTLVSDGAGGAIIAWRDRRNGTANSDVYVQRVRAEGYAQWTTNGVSLCNAAGNQQSLRAGSDGAGGAVVVWEDDRYGLEHAYARRVSASGMPMWAPNGVALFASNKRMNGLALVADGEGGGVAACAGEHDGVNEDVYAQRVDRFGAIGDAEPVIAAVADVPADQGGRVVVRWTPSYLDVDPTFLIDEYSVWREVPTALATPALAAQAASVPRAGSARSALRATTFDTQTYYWEYVGSVPARGREGYSLVAPTTTDSVSGSNPLTRFMVSAEQSGGTPYWDSTPVQGYSVDNLAPPMPEPFTGDYINGVTALQWGLSPAPDFAVFRLHRGYTAGFVPDVGNLIASLTTGGYSDPAGGPCYYRLCAVDAHGNASPYAFLQLEGTVDAPALLLPRELALSAPAPNPLRGSTRLTLALPRAGQVTLAVHDSHGRRVRTLLAGAQPAGEQAVVWDGCDERGRRVASGMYFVFCEVEGRALTRRVVTLR